MRHVQKMRKPLQITKQFAHVRHCSPNISRYHTITPPSACARRFSAPRATRGHRSKCRRDTDERAHPSASVAALRLGRRALRQPTARRVAQRRETAAGLRALHAPGRYDQIGRNDFPAGAHRRRKGVYHIYFGASEYKAPAYTRVDALTAARVVGTAPASYIMCVCRYLENVSSRAPAQTPSRPQG